MSGRNSWLSRIRRWIARVFGLRAATKPTTHILREFDSEFVRLLLLDTDYADDEVERIRVWKAILRTPDAEFDVVITCDRIKRCRTDIRAGELRRLVTTHRFAAFRVSRLSIGGKTKIDQLFIAELDCIRSQVFRGLDGFAPQIADSLALQLRKRSKSELMLLLEFENTTLSRGQVRDRWRDCLLYYYGEYFPESRLG